MEGVEGVEPGAAHLAVDEDIPPPAFSFSSGLLGPHDIAIPPAITNEASEECPSPHTNKPTFSPYQQIPKASPKNIRSSHDKSVDKSVQPDSNDAVVHVQPTKKMFYEAANVSQELPDSKDSEKKSDQNQYADYTIEINPSLGNVLNPVAEPKDFTGLYCMSSISICLCCPIGFISMYLAMKAEREHSADHFQSSKSFETKAALTAAVGITLFVVILILLIAAFS